MSPWLRLQVYTEVTEATEATEATEVTEAMEATVTDHTEVTDTITTTGDSAASVPDSADLVPDSVAMVTMASSVKIDRHFLNQMPQMRPQIYSAVHGLASHSQEFILLHTSACVP
jgi:hypothetical protein